MGRVSQVSNPEVSVGPASTPNLSGSWTTTTYDALGRVQFVTTRDGAQVTTDYGGSTSIPLGTTVTAIDQALKVRRSITDALGRLVRVDEPDSNGNLGSVTSPNQATSYSYDALGNLRMVSQGTQQRFFVNDSLSRLLRARNPETNIKRAIIVNLRLERFPIRTDPRSLIPSPAAKPAEKLSALSK